MMKKIISLVRVFYNNIIPFSVSFLAYFGIVIIRLFVCFLAYFGMAENYHAIYIHTTAATGN